MRGSSRAFSPPKPRSHLEVADLQTPTDCELNRSKYIWVMRGYTC